MLSDHEDEAPRKQRTYVRDAVEILLIALVLYLIIWNALQTVRVDGHSMDKTLNDGDLLLASKVSYAIGSPQRGDIVVLVPPIDKTKDFIKRIIGVPGDIIEIIPGDAKTNPVVFARILIKPGGAGTFQELQEPYLTEDWTEGPACCNPAAKPATTLVTNVATPITIPADEYFVMGDNRNHSEDGRFFGFVPKKDIVAKAFLRIWPLGHFGGLGPGPTLLPAVSVGLAFPLFGFRRLIRRARRR